MAVWLLHLLGWTGIIGPCLSPELPPVSSKSYTPGPCLSRHAKPCGGTVGVQHGWAEIPPDWTNGHDGVCCRASSTYSGRRSPSALDGHPPRDHAHPNKHQAWASCDGRRRPLRFNGRYTWNSYASWSALRAQRATQGALAIHCTQLPLRPSRLCLATGV